MKSPFPGMDPFLEDQEWQDFHLTFNTVVREVLAPRLRPDYMVRAERRVYLEHVGPEPDTFRVGDVAIIARDSGPAAGRTAAGVLVAAPTVCTLPMPEERRETYLVIREHATMEVVTVIETLSPSNKRRNGDGRREYLSKRDEVLASSSHLVELDLLRGGVRPPVVEPLPAADYFCIVSRTYERPRAAFYAWTVKEKLPTILVPLKRGDDDIELPLQPIFETVYDRAGYDLSIDYQRTLEPAPTSDVEAFIKQRIAEHAG